MTKKENHFGEVFVFEIIWKQTSIITGKSINRSFMEYLLPKVDAFSGKEVTPALLLNLMADYLLGSEAIPADCSK